MTSLLTDTIDIPAVGDYRIDPHDCTIAFTMRHLFGLASVGGSFALRDGHIHITDPVHGSSARATISAASFHTGTAARDVTVRSARYLDTEQHPDITFASTRLDQVDGRWVLYGSLTVRGRTRPLPVHIDHLHLDGTHLRLRASARVDRAEFGITALKTIIGRHLTLHLDLAATRT
jgi:polyisoprenoid-binding protein YceI